MNTTATPVTDPALSENHRLRRVADVDVVVGVPGRWDGLAPVAGVAGWGWLAGRRWRRLVFGVLALQVVVVVVFAVAYRPFDLSIYLWGGRAVRHGLELYAVQARGNWFTYPPFAAAVFTPLSMLPPVAAGVAWELASVAALAWSAAACVRLAGYRPGPAGTAAVTAAALLLEPVYHTLYLGQVNVFLLALVTADITRAAAGRRAGLGIGVAAAIKLTPALFIVVLLTARRYRDAATAAAAFTACALAGYLADPAASALYWTRLFDDTSRVSATYISNQSPYATLARLAGGTTHLSPWYPALAAALAAAGLTAATRHARAGHWLAATAATGTTTLLISPISWTHHFVWALPALLTLTLPTTTTSRTRAAARARTAAAAAGYLLFITAPMWFTPWTGHTAQYGYHGLTTLTANSFTIAALAYLTYTTTQALHRPKTALHYSDPLVPVMAEAPT